MDSMHIRPMGPEHLAGFGDVARAAGLQAAVDFMPDYLAWQPDGYLVAQDDAGQVVGAVGAQRFGPVAFIGAMCVLPALQGQGLGRRLMERLLAELPRHGIHTSLLEATAAGAPLYARLGFETDGVTAVMIRAASAPTGQVQGVQPFAAADLNEVMVFDAARFGAPRQVMLRGWMERHGAASFVSRDGNGVLNGYVSVTEKRLGPWLADAPEVAQALLEAALSVCGTVATVMYCAQANAWACRLVEERGFTLMRTMKRMRLGPRVPGVDGSMLALATAGVG